jgi:hypothetical protein
MHPAPDVTVYLFVAPVDMRKQAASLADGRALSRPSMEPVLREAFYEFQHCRVRFDC